MGTHAAVLVHLSCMEYDAAVTSSRQLQIALAAERKALIKERRRIDERLGAIDVLLSEERAEAPARQRLKRPERPRKVNQQISLPKMAGIGIGLREALRQALDGAGFKKPGDVIQALAENGFTVTGKTPLNTRVYNELKRMRNEGELDRDNDGRYALKAA
jgi:hypothetical protein